MTSRIDLFERSQFMRPFLVPLFLLCLAVPVLSAARATAEPVQKGPNWSQPVPEAPPNSPSGVSADEIRTELLRNLERVREFLETQRAGPLPPEYVQAFRKIDERLQAADRDAAVDRDKALARLTAFFTGRKKGARSFASQVLGHRLKYVTSSRETYQKFLVQQFGENLFTPEELEKAVEEVVADFLQTQQLREQLLLAEVRAELKDLPPALVPPSARSEDDFQQEYQRMSERVKASLVREAGVEIGKRVASGITKNILGAVAEAMLKRLGKEGVQGAIAVAGAGLTPVTFGASFILALLIDLAIDRLDHLITGSDAEGRIAARVTSTLDFVQSCLIDGHPDTVQQYRKQRDQERTGISEKARTEARAAAENIEKSGGLGLRYELTKVQSQQAQVRREALFRMLLNN
jgi:hypothetical protein